MFPGDAWRSVHASWMEGGAWGEGEGETGKVICKERPPNAAGDWRFMLKGWISQWVR